jgi:type VII secretion-associated serine protease mycosin
VFVESDGLPMRRLAVLFLAAVLVVLGAATPAYADNIRNREYWLADYGITTAWNVTRGAGVTIAIIDTGVSGTHPDLAGAVVGGADFSGQGSPDGQKTSGSHGTMVAALAAGRGHGSGDGVIGAAPEASILSLSIAFGENVDSDSQVAAAITWAVDHGADVINMSFTRETLDWPESWDTAFLYAEKAGVVMVAAAGNRGSGTAVVGAPATIPGVLTVAGLDRNGKASFDASAQGITIGVSAPSEQLVGATPGGGYSLWSGTSGAAPIVAGIAALVKAAHPELDAAGVIQRIIATARPAGADGVDPLYGYGLVDAAAAVSADVADVSVNPMGDLSDWIRLNRRADAPPVTPSTGAMPIPESTPIGPPESAVVALLPSLPMLRDVGIPLLLFAGFFAAFVVLLVGAGRHFGRLRRRG